METDIRKRSLGRRTHKYTGNEKNTGRTTITEIKINSCHFM